MNLEPHRRARTAPFVGTVTLGIAQVATVAGIAKLILGTMDGEPRFITLAGSRIEFFSQDGTGLGSALVDRLGAEALRMHFERRSGVEVLQIAGPRRARIHEVVYAGLDINPSAGAVS